MLDLTIRPTIRPALASALAVLTIAAAAAGGEPSFLDLKEITSAQGADTVELARSAMTQYLHRRSSPASIALTPRLAKLSQYRNAVAVTLRREGSVVAVEVHGASDLRTNLIVAALQAMRSPGLPDRVDDKVLDSLTVEIEVLGKPAPAEADNIRLAVVPGLTGIQCGRGRKAVHVLPSAAYVLGMSPERMLRGAVLRARPATTASAGPEVAVFATRHFVGYPNSQTFELYRGKVSAAHPELDERAALAVAGSIGRYLAAGQDDTGRYAVGNGATSLTEHLHVTWAMARLAARLRSPELAKSVRIALAAAEKEVVRGDGRATVNAPTPAESLAATGLMAMALGIGDEKGSADLRRELLAGLAEDLTAPTSRPGTETGGVALTARGSYIALLAMETNPACAPAVAATRRKLLQHRPADAEAALWALRASAAAAWPPEFGNPSTAPGLTRRGQSAQADDRGGFCIGNEQPQTHITALAAVYLAKLLAGPAGFDPKTTGELASQRDQARAFCAHMVYRPKEAHFAADPNAWIGAVRATPGAAAVSAAACAATIEALLAGDRRGQ